MGPNSVPRRSNIADRATMVLSSSEIPQGEVLRLIQGNEIVALRFSDGSLADPEGTASIAIHHQATQRVAVGFNDAAVLTHDLPAKVRELFAGIPAPELRVFIQGKEFPFDHYRKVMGEFSNPPPYIIPKDFPAHFAIDLSKGDFEYF